MNRTDARSLLGRRAVSRIGRLDVSVGEAVIHSGLPARVIHRAIQAGELPVHEVVGKAGREYHIRLDALERFVGQQTPELRGAERPTANGSGRHVVIAWPGRRTPLRIYWPTVLVAVALTTLLILGVMAAGQIVGTPASAPATATSAPSHAAHPSAKSPSSLPATSLTTGTSFTLIVGRRGGGNVMIRGAVAGGGALTPRMQTLYLGCLVRSSRSGARDTLASPGTTADSSVTISSTMQLPPSVLQRLQSWATAYSALLDSGDTRVSNLVDAAQHGKLEQENMDPWKWLREALGPNYVILDYQANHHSDLRVAADQCSAAPAPQGIAGLVAPLSTAQLDLMRWLRIMHDRGAPCAAAYGALVAQLRRTLSGAADSGTTQSAITEEHSACHAATVVAMPRSLTGAKTAARTASLALTSAFRLGRAAEPNLPDIATGNTNAGEIRQAIALLNHALGDYKRYIQAAATVARARGVPVPYK